MFTYQDLSSLGGDSDVDLAQLKGLFCRLALDEDHGIRRCVVKQMGRTLRALDADRRWIFTGTIIYNTLEDFLRALYFLERPD